MSQDTNITAKVDPNIIRLLIDIKKEVGSVQSTVDKVREETNALAIILQSSFEELSERVSGVESRLDGLETEVKRGTGSYKTLRYEFDKLKRRVDGNDKSLAELRDGIVEVVKEHSDHDLKAEADLAATIIHVRKLEKSVMHMTLEIKKDPLVIIPSFLMVVGVGLFVWFGKISWEIGVAFVMTGGLMPAIIGRKNKKEHDEMKEEINSKANR